MEISQNFHISQNKITLAWGGFSGNSKKEYIAKKTAMETGKLTKKLFAFTGHLAYEKNHMVII